MNKGPGNPFALGLVLVGAFAMGIAAFLPLDEPGAFRRVSDNSLIQHGGWMLIALAIGIAASGFRANQGKEFEWALTVVLCLVAGFRIFMWAADTGLRTLYPVGADGTPNTSQPGTVVSLGIGVYVAGAGTAVALAGALMLYRTAKDSAAEAVDGAPASLPTKTKKCPDCAETILADAKVCKHCGYRFATGTPAAPAKAKLNPEKSTKPTRCHHCQHVQAVPVDQATFVCEECGTKLKRRTAPAKGS